jgi:hypothetical protein
MRGDSWLLPVDRDSQEEQFQRQDHRLQPHSEIQDQVDPRRDWRLMLEPMETTRRRCPVEQLVVSSMLERLGLRTHQLPGLELQPVGFLPEASLARSLVVQPAHRTARQTGQTVLAFAGLALVESVRRKTEELQVRTETVELWAAQLAGAVQAN